MLFVIMMLGIKASRLNQNNLQCHDEKSSSMGIPKRVIKGSISLTPLLLALLMTTFYSDT